MTSDPASLEERIRSLEEAIRRLEERISAPPLRASVAASSAANEPAAQTTTAPTGAGTPLAAAAVLCVVLLFALVLRTAADVGWLPASLGPAAGVAYCAVLLIVAGLVFPRTRLMGTLVGVTAAAAGFLIVIETYHRRATLPLPVGLLVLAGIAAACVVVGRRAQSGAVAGMGLLGSALVATFLDLRNVTFWWLGAELVVLSLAALWLASSNGWTWLRWPMFLLAQLVTFVWAMKLQVHTDDEKLASYGTVLIALNLLFVAASALRAARRPERLDAFLAAMPFAATVIPAYAFGRSAPQEVAPIAAGVAMLMLAYGTWHLLRRDAEIGGTGAFLFAGASLALWWWPEAFPQAFLHAPLLSAVALGIFVIAADSRATSARPISHALQLGAMLLLSAKGPLFRAPDSSAASWALGGVALAAVAWAQFARGRRPLDEKSRADAWALLSLIASVLAAFGALRLFGFVCVGASGTPEAMQVYQSLAAAALVGGAVFVALWKRWPDLQAASLVGLALVAGKVVLYDLFTLPGSYAILPVLVVAVLLGTASVAIQRRSRKDSPGS